MEQFFPEGMGRSAAELSTEQLRRAAAEGTVLESRAILCDEEHNLSVDLGGGRRGIIPRAETALGIREGTVRDIAVLSRVGRPVCFKVVARCGEKYFRLSRLAAQKEALAAMLSGLRPGSIVPAVVTSIADFGVFCDIGCGVTALLGAERISVSRAADPAERFRPGQKLFAVIRNIDRESGRITLTHRERLGTWAENATRFAVGQTVPGTVRSVRDYGVFIELTPNLSGLTEPDSTLYPGEAVSVLIRSIQPEKTKIKLNVVSRLGQSPEPAPMHYVRTHGRLDFWQYGPDEKPRFHSDFLISSQ